MPNETPTLPVVDTQAAPVAEMPAPAPTVEQQLANAQQDKDIVLAGAAKAKEMLAAAQPREQLTDASGVVMTQRDLAEHRANAA
jgi:hypothetical protein